MDANFHENAALSATVHLNDYADINVDLDLAITRVQYAFDIEFDSNIFNDIPPVNVKNAYVKVSEDSSLNIDDWLNVCMKFNIWDTDNSPLHLSGHWENMKRVEECTYRGDGVINGSVEDADDHTKAVSNALIEVIDEDSGDVITSGTSDADGRYTIDNILAGTYTVRVSADGYLSYESVETVYEGETTFVETFLMVEGEEDSGLTGVIGGQVINSVNGLQIDGVQITVYKGRNVTSGTVITTVYTDADGRYTAELPIGNYTLVMTCDGYISNHINAAVTQQGNQNCNANLTPDGSGSIALGDMQIVLTWGEQPLDLDSHLRGPGTDYHVWYRQKVYSDAAGNRADLDLDDRHSYGPETTTIYDMQADGVYSFYVHNYSKYAEE